MVGSMKKSLIVCICFFITTSMPIDALDTVETNNQESNAVKISFEDALQRMLSSNDSVLAAKNEEDQRRHEKSAAFGLYFPKIETKANAVQLSDPVTVDLNDIRTAILEVQKATLQGAGLTPAQINAVSQGTAAKVPPFEKTLVEERFMSVDAGIKGPIFTGGKISAANDAAAARVNEAGYKLDDTRNRLISELVTRYFGLRLAVKVVDVRSLVLEGMSHHLSDAKALEKNGMIAHVERLHAEVSYADAARELKKSERIRELSVTALNNTLSGTERFEPSTALFVFSDIEPVELFQRSAVEKNPLLKQIQTNRELARALYKKELSTFSPDIFYYGNYQLYGYKTSESLPKWMVGVGATATIFEGFSGYEKVRAAHFQEERVIALENKARKDIRTLIDKNYQELMLSLEQYHAIQSSYAFAEEYLRVREKAFKEGAATSLDVVDARLAFAKVRIDRLKTVYDFDVALSSLLEASGMSNQFIRYLNRKDVEVKF
jgi:outer membrane protein TolC